MGKNCQFCQNIEKDRNNGNICELAGGWNLSHFIGENEWYLGRLMLRTNCHRPNWNTLTPDELKSLGYNVQSIISKLKKYWETQFQDDCLEQVHVAYLNEAPYKKGLSTNEINEKLHIHFHLLPRTKNILESIKKYYPCELGKAIGWRLVEYTDCFPEEYSKKEEEPKLMNFLKNSLPTKSK